MSNNNNNNGGGMMAYNAAAGLNGMLRSGSRSYTQNDAPASGSVVVRNIDACYQIARMISSSYGPNGRCKLIQNHLGRLNVTSDCATILKNMEIEHPAVQLLVSAIMKQEEICGDNTNYVCTIGGELLYQTAILIGKMSWQPANDILFGYQQALQLIQTQYLPMLLVSAPSPSPPPSPPTTTSSSSHRDHLLMILKPVLASKVYGAEDVLAPLIADACLSVMKTRNQKTTNTITESSSSSSSSSSAVDVLSVEAIRTVKILGAPVSSSCVLCGGYVALRNVDSVCTSTITNSDTTTDTTTTATTTTECKIVVYACSIEASTTEAKGTVVMKNASDLLSYNKTEEEHMCNIIDTIAATGVKVIVTSGNVSDVALHYIDRHNILLLRIGSKWELRRLCQAIHATALVRLGPPTLEEMGYCSYVQQQEMGGKPVTVFMNDTINNSTNQNQKQNHSLATIILRASTSTVLADLERAVDDGVQAIAQAMKDPRIVYGGGAFEMSLSVLLQKEATKTPGLSQYALAAFGKALEIIPKTLAENAGLDPIQVLAHLQTAHSSSTMMVGSDPAMICDVGVDINSDTNTTTNTNNKMLGTTSMKDMAIYDLVSSKISALQLAVDAVITILKIDQIIMSKPAGIGGK